MLQKHSVVYLITKTVQVKIQENCSHAMKYLNNLTKGLVLYLLKNVYNAIEIITLNKTTEEKMKRKAP